MSLTKIGSIGINTGIAFAGVTTIATLNGSDAVLSVGGTVNFVSDVSIGGTVSIAGTLTYEDVTNVDAVGLITARDGIVVGSGITLSKDGDVFFTGIATGNGSGLTALNATQLTSGTVPDARFPATLPAVSGANLTNLPAANVTGTLPAISGANLTSLTAGNLTGALPAISGANLTGIAATDNVRTGILDVAGIATFRSDVNLPNINGGQIGGRRNLIINGVMQVAQRGTSFTASGGYTLDRWRLDDAMSAGGATVTQSTTSPDGFSHSLKVDITSADTSVAAGEYAQFYQYIEAQNLQHLAYGTSSAKTVTISFYVRSNKTGGYNLAILQSDASSRLVSFQYTIDSADTWERKSFTIPGDASGQIDNDNGIGYSIFWGHAYGTNYTSGSLQSTFSGYSASNFGAGQAVNLYDSTSNEWYITGVQLEVGDTATSFEHRSIGEELALCQRYYYRHATGNGKGISENATMYNGSSVFLSIPLPTEMRDQPTLDVTNSTSHFLKYENNGGTNFDTLGRDGVTTPRLLCVNGTVSGTAGNACMVRTNSNNAYIAADAEL